MIDVVRGVVEVDVETLPLGQLERGDDVGLVLVAVAGGDGDESQPELSIVTRSASSTCGTPRVWIFTRMTCSWTIAVVLGC